MTKNKNHEMLQCSICNGDVDHHRTKEGEVFWTEGHNADPINIKGGNGRACDWCNDNVVVPVRLKMMGCDPEAYARVKDTLPVQEIAVDKIVDRPPLR